MHRMKIKITYRFIKKVQLFLGFFIAFTTLIGGTGLAITNGLGMNTEILEPTPFSSFIIPGLILAGIVGGTHILAFYYVIKKKNDAQFFAAVAGFGLIIWLFVEVYWLLNTSPLQPVYFAFGILELMCVLGLKDIAPWLTDNKIK